MMFVSGVQVPLASDSNSKLLLECAERIASYGQK